MSHAEGGEPLPEIETIHERLVFARRRGKFTQREFAERLGIGVRTLQDYESGSTHIPAHLVPQVERLCSLPPGWVLYDGSAEEFERRRRGLPPIIGSMLVLLALASPTAANATAVSCQCVTIRDGRQLRFSLARRGSRSLPGRGRLRFDLPIDSEKEEV